MGCLFCDQAPESIDARKKIAKITEIIGCTANFVVQRVVGLMNELTAYKRAYDRTKEERDRFRAELMQLREEVYKQSVVGLMNDLTAYKQSLTQVTPPWVGDTPWILDRDGKKRTW